MSGRAIEPSGPLARTARRLAGIAALSALLGCSSALDSDNALPVHCLDKPNLGRCQARVPAYYYDYPSNSCRVLHSGGCPGYVRFGTREACEEACVAGR